MPDRSPSKLRASRRYVKGEEQESNPPSRRARRWGTRKSTERFFDYPPRPEIVTARFPSETGRDAPLRMTNRDAGRVRARGLAFVAAPFRAAQTTGCRAKARRYVYFPGVKVPGTCMENRTSTPLM